MWTAELFIADEYGNYHICGFADASFTADTKQKAIDGIMHYVMTMCEDTDKIVIKLTRSKQ